MPLRPQSANPALQKRLQASNLLIFMSGMSVATVAPMGAVAKDTSESVDEGRTTVGASFASSGEHHEIGNIHDAQVIVPVPVRPTPERLQSLRGILATYGPSLSSTERNDIDRCLQLGAYTAALEIAEQAARKVPTNVSLMHLANYLHAASAHAIEDRLGSLHRYVVWSKKPISLGPELLCLLDLAKERITIAEIVRARQANPLRTIELVLRLVHHGVLLLGPERRSH